VCASGQDDVEGQKAIIKKFSRPEIQSRKPFRKCSRIAAIGSATVPPQAHDFLQPRLHQLLFHQLDFPTVLLSGFAA
jgi:hypothetical protein